jgi:hypothetical protein
VPSSGSGRGYTPPDGSFQYQGNASEPTREWSSKDETVELASNKPGDTIAIPPSARREVTLDFGLADQEEPATHPEPEGIVVRASDERGGAGRSVEIADLMSREPIVRTIEPGSRPSMGTSPTPPRSLAVPGRMIDITELPKPDSARRPNRRSSGGEIQLVSGTESTEESAVRHAVATDSFSPRNDYGHGPEYTWLKGRLEYSQIDRQWKVRYIPIDGETDDFGGSVILSDASLLSGYERGDFVEIRGALVDRDSKDNSYAPEYRISQIKKLGR